MTENRTILVTGANGLIGKALCTALCSRGYSVRTLSRSHGDFTWDITAGYIDTNALNGVSCVVHLAGETIAQRWTPDSKERILQSRVQSTRLLVKEILRQSPTADLICASGINCYSDGFLAEVCREWERAAGEFEISKRHECAKHGSQNAPSLKIIRTGVVLSRVGGALTKMLPPFKAGLGGRIGSGEQMMSWISLEDIVRIYIRAIEDSALSGAIDAVSPHPVSNAEFTAALGNALHRPTILPLPAFMVNLLFGEMGRETILADLNILPKKLQQCGFEWKHPDINSALQSTLA